ncbi:MAG: phosphatase PAP2 family protein [Clostridia bacterium]|nr:phosphatase PAP2 family protein [Clostridia bacterium]
MKKLNKSLITGIVLFVAFAVFTVLVKVVDVAAVGPLGSKVGFSKMNDSIFKGIGTSDTWYSISEVFGIFALIVAGVFVIVGLVQLIRRKNLKLVDNHILALGVFYVVVAMAYIFFEVLVINHRPVLAQGVLEASYPSSHSMLAVCILSSAIIEFHKFFDGKKKQLIALDTISIVIMLVIVIGRLLSGMHWFTDIIGGILLSLALVFLYHGILKIIEKKIEMKNNKA